MLFIDYSSAFNTILPSKLVLKLRYLGLCSAICRWIYGFLAGRPQTVRVNSNYSSTVILNTSSPQGCCLSPLLYSLFTYDCVANHPDNYIMKFAGNTTVIGLITDNEETAYRKNSFKSLGIHITDSLSPGPWIQGNQLRGHNRDYFFWSVSRKPVCPQQFSSTSTDQRLRVFSQAAFWFGNITV